jgi:hypothetical protein
VVLVLLTCKELIMAKKKSSLTSRFQSGLKTHSQDQTDYGADFSDPPPGIMNGIAQLTGGSIGEYKSGKYQGEKFCRLTGTIVSPKEHVYRPRQFENGKIVTSEPVKVVTEGLFTSVMVPLCDTVNGKGEKTGVEDNIGTLLNELRKLGGDTSELETEEELGELIDAMVEAAPYFKFGTSSSDPTKDYPTPRTWQNWYGDKGLDDYTPEEIEDEVEDTSEEESVEEEEVEEEEVEEGLSLLDVAKNADENEDADAARIVAERAEGCGVDPEAYDTWVEVAEAVEGGGSGFGEEEEETEEEEAGEEVAEGLGDQADEGDEEAQEALTEKAAEAGLDPDEYGTWAELEQALTEGAEAEEEEETEAEEEEEEYTPDVGDVVLYQPKGAKKSYECEVKTANTKLKTSTLVRMDDNKKYSSVPWSSFTV